mgnify:FL=1
MSSEERDIQEILLHLKNISNNLISSEMVHNEMKIFKDVFNEKQIELKGEVKDLSDKVNEIDRNLLDFKRDMSPILEIKNHIQGQLIRYSSIAFTILLAATVGINNMG